MSTFECMYLIPRDVYNTLIIRGDKITKQALSSGAVRQLNNLDVREGGRVIIRNDDHFKTTHPRTRVTVPDAGADATEDVGDGLSEEREDTLARHHQRKPADPTLSLPDDETMDQQSAPSNTFSRDSRIDSPGPREQHSSRDSRIDSPGPREQHSSFPRLDPTLNQSRSPSRTQSLDQSRSRPMTSRTRPASPSRSQTLDFEPRVTSTPHHTTKEDIRTSERESPEQVNKSAQASLSTGEPSTLEESGPVIKRRKTELDKSLRVKLPKLPDNVLLNLPQLKPKVQAQRLPDNVLLNLPQFKPKLTLHKLPDKVLQSLQPTLKLKRLQKKASRYLEGPKKLPPDDIFRPDQSHTPKKIVPDANWLQEMEAEDAMDTHGGDEANREVGLMDTAPVASPAPRLAKDLLAKYAEPIVTKRRHTPKAMKTVMSYTTDIPRRPERPKSKVKSVSLSTSLPSTKSKDIVVLPKIAHKKRSRPGDTTIIAVKSKPGKKIKLATTKTHPLARQKRFERRQRMQEKWLKPTAQLPPDSPEIQEPNERLAPLEDPFKLRNKKILQKKRPRSSDVSVLGVRTRPGKKIKLMGKTRKKRPIAEDLEGIEWWEPNAKSFK